MIYLDYYNRPFLLFHSDIKDKVHRSTAYLRKDFWSNVPEGVYENIRAQDLFHSYSKTIERRAKAVIAKYSIEYWLHLSRRIGIGSGGENNHDITIITNRFYVLSLIQKYGLIRRCGHINDSKKVEISQIFSGLLLSEEFAAERQIIEEQPAQLVLTDFTSLNLLEYYEVENLAYELWVCAAKLRSIGKGARIIVIHSQKDYVFEVPDETLDILINSYDSRLSSNLASETGTVFSNESIDPKSEIFVPVVNTSNITLSYLNPIIKEFLNIDLEGEAPSNFILVPFPIRKFIEAHEPFVEDFITEYNVSYKSIIGIFSALCYRYFYMTVFEKKPTLLKVSMRGYEGPFTKDEIVNEINFFLPTACKLLNIDVPNQEEQINAFNFLELIDQSKIEVFNLGTLKIFQKANEDYYIVDYTVIPTLLNNLFNTIKLNKHQFRGELFEKSIGIINYLPNKPCKSISGSQKQIDFSHLIGDVLIVGECKVVSRRLSFFLGSYRAIRLREEKVVNKGLREADDKANWLIKNPIGTNYDISYVRYILPVALSPFVEYIHSTNEWYWINNDIPRVLSLKEIKSFVETFDKTKIIYNLIKTGSDGK